MKVIYWNVKGLGSLKKNISIKETFRKFKLDFIMLQEPKNMEINKRCLSSIWGISSPEWISSPADGTAGGMLIGWKSDLFEAYQTEYGVFSVCEI